MATLSENIRKITTFLLAVFLWAHALFFLNVQSAFAARFAQYLRLTISETILLALLVIFSFASGSGFWKPFRSLLYIYAFPFVLFWKFLYLLFRAMRALHRWFKSQAYPAVSESTLVVQKDSTPASPPQEAATKTKFKETVKEVLSFLVRPFRRFTFLWCFLLLTASHIAIVWVCLVVLALHLARRIFKLLKVMLFFDPLMKKFIDHMFNVTGTAVGMIDAFTPGAAPPNELRNQWNSLKFWRFVTGFLRDEYLVSRWAWVLGAVTFGSLYIYIALLFSFVYFGVARVSGISFPWITSLTASLFIPLFASELPKTNLFRVIGGIHCALALTVGIGTFFGFLHRRLFAIRAAATVVNDRLVDKIFEQKYSALGALLAVPVVPATGVVQQQVAVPETPQKHSKKGKKRRPK
jgi:hypothetical protein